MAEHPDSGDSQGDKTNIDDSKSKPKPGESSEIKPNTLEYAISQFNLNRRIVIKDIPPVTYDEVKQFLGDVVVNNITISKKARQAVVTLSHGEQAEDLVDLHNGETMLGTLISMALQPNDRLLCVTHLPFNMDDSDFRSMLEPFGALERCFLMRSDRDRSKGYGFVEFQHNRDQSAEVCNQLDSRKVGSCVLHCDFVSPTLTTFSDLHSSCLLIDHLPPSYRGADRLREVFCKLQEPTYFQLVMKGSDPLGFAVAEYPDYRTAEATQLELNHFRLDNYNIRVTYCIPGLRAGDVYAQLVSGMSRNGMPKRGASLLPSPNDHGSGGHGGPLLGNAPGSMGPGYMGPPPGGRHNMGPHGPPHMGPDGPNFGPNRDRITNPQMAALLQQSPQLLQTFQNILGQLQQNNTGMMGPPGPGGGPPNQLVDPNMQVALLAVMMAMQLQQAQPNLATSPLLAQMTANMPQQPGQGKPSLLGNPMIAQANSMLQDLFQNPHQGPNQPAPFNSPNMPALSPSALNNLPQLMAMLAQGLQGGPPPGGHQEGNRGGLLGHAPPPHRHGLLGNGPRPFMGPPDAGGPAGNSMGPANPLLALFLETQIRQCMNGNNGPPMGGPPGNMTRPPGPHGGMSGPPGPGGYPGGPRGPRGNGPLLGDGPWPGFNQHRPPLLGPGPAGPGRSNRPLLGPRPGPPGMPSGPLGPPSPEEEEYGDPGMFNQHQGPGGPPPRGPLLGQRPRMNNSGPLLGSGPGPSGPSLRPALLGAGPGGHRTLLGDAPGRQSNDSQMGLPPMASRRTMSDMQGYDEEPAPMPPYMEGRTFAKPGMRRGPLLGRAPSDMEERQYDRQSGSEYSHQGNNPNAPPYGNHGHQASGLLGDEPGGGGSRRPGLLGTQPGNRSGLLGKRPGSDDNSTNPGRPLLGNNWSGGQQAGGLLGNAPNGRWQTWDAGNQANQQGDGRNMNTAHYSEYSQGARPDAGYQQGSDMAPMYGNDEPSADDNCGVYHTNMSSGVYQTNMTAQRPKPKPGLLPKPESTQSQSDSAAPEQASNAKIYASMMQFYNALCEGSKPTNNTLAEYFGHITAKLASQAATGSGTGGQTQNQSQNQRPPSQYSGYTGEKNYNFSKADRNETYVFGTDTPNPQMSNNGATRRQDPYANRSSFAPSGSLAVGAEQENSYFSSNDYGSPDQPVFMTSSYKSNDSPGDNNYESQMWTPPSNKRPRLLPSPEPSPEGPYVGQHSQGIGGHYAETHIKKHRF